MSQDLIELAESMAICWGLGLLVIVTRVSKFFSNSGWWMYGREFEDSYGWYFVVIRDVG